ncbi:hypothetical protein FB45DRAFT_1055220 [Roridomyces roridus]|uniref:F-box domain-containing protein n=1 Tax=Roridomyces roridus TaxID=1738132 RepID=A0AAD7C4T4_9AGAR|nr:hypothetical protein FB45DRAFT_1055220 [Roridomyces roridus]
MLDLPDELLLLILDHSDLHSLLSLSVLCRRLHYIALPLYFTRHGIEHPTEHAKFDMLDNGKDVLSALQVALFVPSIGELSCVFPHYQSIHPLFSHIRRLCRLFARLAFVHRVTLVLDGHASLCGDSSDEGAATWAVEFGALLNTILQRGCSHFTVRYGQFFTKALRSRPSRPAQFFRNLRQTELQLESATDVAMEFDSEMSNLTHFSIESAVFLVPPCLSWSLSALEHCPITCLEIFGIALQTKVWSVMLPAIAAAIPALAELGLSKLYGIAGIDILQFLAKLPRLKRLTIGYTEYSKRVQSSCPDSGPVPKLYDLIHLSAPSTFISHFLKKKTLPSLESLCITPRTLILGSRGMRHIGRSVSDIVRRLEKYKLAPTVSLEIHRGRDADSEMAADLAMLPGEDLMRSLRAITRLIIYSDVGLATVEFGTLARWIACFPALEEVSLRVDEDVTWPSMDYVRRAISERNPHVKSLELNGVRLSENSREMPPSITGV